MNLFAEDKSSLPKGLFGSEMMVGPFDVLQMPDALAPTLERALRSKNPDGIELFTIVLLSQTNPPFGLFCTIEGEIGAGRISNVQVRLQRKPNLNPPKDFLTVSDHFKGYPTGLPALMAALGGPSEISVFAELKCLVTDAVLWPTKIPSRYQVPPPDPFTLESDRYLLKSPRGDLDIFYVSAGAYQFMTRAKCQLRLDSGCFESAQAQLWPIFADILADHASTLPA